MQYAQLDNINICIGFLITKKSIENPKMIEIEGNQEDYLWRKYENGEWSEEKYPPPEPAPEPVISMEDYLLDLEFRLSILEMGGM